MFFSVLDLVLALGFPVSASLITDSLCVQVAAMPRV